MSSFWGAVLGGLLGGTIPGWVSYVTLRHAQRERRQARQWDDAVVLADVYRLLVDIDPARRTISVRPEAGVEDERWADFNRRLGGIRTGLLTIAGGHRSANVQALAKRLEPELFAAVTHSQHSVNDRFRGRDYQEQLKYAQKCHATALATADELDQAVKSAGLGTRTRRGLGGLTTGALGRGRSQ
jgi:hypothetical protein